MGCILYQIVFCKKPFNDDFDVIRYQLSEERLSLPPESKHLPDEIQKTLVSGLILSMLEVDPDRRPTAEEVDKRFKLGTPSTAVPMVTASGFLPYQDFIATNQTNTRMATVTHDCSRRLQHLWKMDAEEPQIIWVREGKYDDERKIYPSFSPEGEYVCFDDGAFRFILIHTTTLEECVVDPQVSFRKLSSDILDLQTNKILSLTVGPAGRRIGIVVQVPNPRNWKHDSLLQDTVNTSLSIDVIPCNVTLEKQPEMCYAASAPNVFVSFGTPKDGEGRQTIVMTGFNLSSGRRAPRRCILERIWISKAVVGTTQIAGEEFGVSDLDFEIRARKRLGFLHPRTKITERRVCLITSAGDVVRTHPVPKDLQMLISNSQIIFYNSGDGTILDSQAKSLYRIAGPIDDDTSQYGMPVAFHEGILTFLSKAGKFRVVKTETLECQAT
jgi:hypothetical protein